MNKKRIPIKNTIFFVCCTIVITYIIFFILGYMLKLNCNTWLPKVPSGNLSLSDPKYILFLKILKNNILVGIALSSGIILFGISTIAIIAANGFFLGLTTYYELQNNSLLNYLALVLPHGIFEMLGLVAFSITGLIPVLIILDKLRNKIITPKYYLKIYLTFFTIGVVLTLISAFIESYITRALA